MEVTFVPIVIGAFGTVTKGLLKVLEGLEVGRRVKTILTTALLKTARILRRVLETWRDLLSLKLQWKPSANTDVKNSQGVNNNVLKWEKEINGGTKPTKSLIHKDALSVGKLQVLWNIGSGHHQTSRNKRKIRKKLLQKNKINTWAVYFVRYSVPFLK